MSKNVLFVGEIPAKIMSGKDVANKHNYQIIKKIFDSSFYAIELGTPIFFEKVCFYSGGLTREVVFRVFDSIIKNRIDVVFLSTSAIGKLAKKIKRKFPGIVIITFFHNIERHYAEEQVKVMGVRKIPTLLSLSFNEYLISKYSDFHVVLNERDAILLRKNYGKDADLIAPIAIEDKFRREPFRDKVKDDTRLALFVGTSFFPNIEGLRWYLNRVKPYTNDRLLIVGKGMDNYKSEFSSEDVEVLGFVDDLAELYNRADYVIMPIFSGGGMKTKTAEAFMYAKTVLGTKEAFEGYENVNSNFAIECNDEKEFIDSVNIIMRQKQNMNYNPFARSYYLLNNSLDSVMHKWQSFFVNIGVI